MVNNNDRIIHNDTGYNYGIGYNEELGVYFSKQDMIDYHRYKASVKSDLSQNYHLQMAKKIEKYGKDE